MLRVNDPAPNFSAKNQLGVLIELKELLKAGPVVMFFYPQDSSPVCTLEARGFDDELSAFAAIGATVIGVNPGNCDSHRRFVEKAGLRYDLLSDDGKAIAKAYGVLKLGIMVDRVTYVIDQSGKIIFTNTGMFKSREHAVGALKALHLNPGKVEDSKTI